MKGGWAVALGLALAAPAWTAYGPNKFIGEPLTWRILVTEHFRLHYTPDCEPLTPEMATLLESAHRHVTGVLGVEVPGRTDFFLTSSHNEFEQNNVVDVDEGTGGVTEAFKNRIIVFHSGRRAWLAHVVPHEFTHRVQFEVLYGGFWRSVRLLKSPFYPLWVMEGMAEYASGDVDQTEEDMVLRDAATSGTLYPLTHLHGFNHLKPHQVTLAYKEGGAALGFLAETQGPAKVGQLLRAMPDKFEAGTLMSDVVGMDLDLFDARYRSWLVARSTTQVAALGLKEPDSFGRRLTPDNVLPVFHTHPVFSPDGKDLAFFTDQSGQNRLALLHLKSGAVEDVVGPQVGVLENLHANGRGISFSSDNRWIAFAGECRQRDYVYLWDRATRRLRRLRLPFDEVGSPQFSPTGDRLVVRVQEKGQVDLFEISLRGQVLRRRTHTREAEDSPAYSPDGRWLVFSREVATSSGTYQQQLVALDGKNDAERILPSPGGDAEDPVFTPDSRAVLFVADPDHVWDIYRLNWDDGTLTRLTRVIGGNRAPTVSKDGALAFTSYRRQSQQIYLAEGALLEGGVPVSPQTPASPWVPAETCPPSTPTSAATPYRFRASTDLFFPVFFYSSNDGLFTAFYWQASDNLGNHTLSTNFQYNSGRHFLDYDTRYTYRRFRPEVSLLSRGENVYKNVELTELRREQDLAFQCAWPFGRFSRTETTLGWHHREDLDNQFPELDTRSRDHYVEQAYVRDTSVGRYLAVTSGGRLRLSYRLARRAWGGTRDYASQSLESHRFLPFGGDHTLALRGALNASAGDSPEKFRLGGYDRVRGVSRSNNAHEFQRTALVNLESRWRLGYWDVPGILFMPDVSLKGLYGTVFYDAGAGWDRRQELHNLSTRILHAVGAGLRFPFFILQSFPLTGAVEAARRLDERDWTIYVTLGPAF